MEIPPVAAILERKTADVQESPPRAGVGKLTKPVPFAILWPLSGEVPSPLSGGMAEWLIAAVLKTVDRKIRGFESLSLRLRTR